MATGHIAFGACALHQQQTEELLAHWHMMKVLRGYSSEVAVLGQVVDARDASRALVATPLPP